MAYVQRISSYTDFHRRGNNKPKGQQLNHLFKNYSAKNPICDLNFNQNKNDFQTSSMRLVQAKYEQQPINNRENDPVFLAGAYRVLRFMHDAWISEQFCDMCFHLNDETILAHKMAVASYSQKMADEFAKFAKNEFVVVELNGFKTEVLWLILKFIYTTDIGISDAFLNDILECAKELGMDVLVKICENHLDNFNPSNAMLYYSIATENNFTWAINKISAFICKNFVAIVNSPAFAQLTLAELMNLIQRDDICLSSELDLFLAIVRWIEFDKPTRKPYAEQLIRCVRFNMIAPAILVSDVEVHTDLFESRACFTMLYDAMKFHALRLSGSSNLIPSSSPSPRRKPLQKQNQPSLTRQAFDQSFQTKQSSQSMPLATKQEGPRHCTRQAAPTYHVATPNTAQFTSTFEAGPMLLSSKVDQSYPPGSRLIATGGVDFHNLTNEAPGKLVYILDPQTLNWQVLAAFAMPKHHHAAVVVAGKLCIVGGCVVTTGPDGTQLGSATNELLSFDIERNTWYALAPMNECRSYAAVAAQDKEIYIVGGENENKELSDTVEKYDGVYNRWVYLGRLQGGAKLGCSVAVLNNNLYVIGGYSRVTSEGSVLADVECFDLDTKRWISKRQLPSGRCHASVAVSNGIIYLIGGRMRCSETNTMYSVGSVLCYDEAHDLWQQVTSLSIPRHDAGCAVVGEKIFVVGGMTSPGLDCLSTVECFDTNNGTWLSGVNPLPVAATGMACASI